MPIASYQHRGQIHRGHADIKKEMADGKIVDKISILIEFDLSQIKQIKKALGLSKLDCYPLFWCFQEMRTETYKHSFSQRVACTYLALKLIDRHPFHDSDSDGDGLEDINIDMF